MVPLVEHQGAGEHRHSQVQLAPPCGIGAFVVREDVKGDTHVDVGVVLCQLGGEHGVLHTKLVELVKAVFVGLVRLERHALWQLVHDHLCEFVVVLARHHYIGVVVPRDETVVADSAQQRAAAQIILDVVLFADAVDLAQVGDLHFLQRLKSAVVNVRDHRNLAVVHVRQNAELYREVQIERGLAAAVEDLRVSQRAGVFVLAVNKRYLSLVAVDVVQQRGDSARRGGAVLAGDVVRAVLFDRSAQNVNYRAENVGQVNIRELFAVYQRAGLALGNGAEHVVKEGL